MKKSSLYACTRKAGTPTQLVPPAYQPAGIRPGSGSGCGPPVCEHATDAAHALHPATSAMPRTRDDLMKSSVAWDDIARSSAKLQMQPRITAGQRRGSLQVAREGIAARMQR